MALRAPIIKRAGGRCEVCGRPARRLVCHERWRYDDEQGLAQLWGLRAQCNDCDQVVHWGHSQQLANAGKLDMSKVQAHYVALNGIDWPTADRLLRQAFNTWQNRSARPWRIDYGAFPQPSK